MNDYDCDKCIHQKTEEECGLTWVHCEKNWFCDYEEKDEEK